MLTFNGTHGTTLVRANDIFLNGFQATEIGRAGYGVYFWKFEEKDVIARDLAIGWFNSQCRRNEYRERTQDLKCAIIYGSIDVRKEEALIFTSELLELIALTLYELPKINDEDMHTAYEYIISGLEKKLNTQFIVIQSTVSAPPKMSFKVGSIIGSPSIFVVRKHIDRIKKKLVVPN